mmetsp:Transcript_5808/g.21160  ORF Transcript_5808/g.21160 Transcript_5808/m.21160 type:complete len:335 (+) Transcript_5808:760-1764(+)
MEADDGDAAMAQGARASLGRQRQAASIRALPRDAIRRGVHGLRGRRRGKEIGAHRVRRREELARADRRERERQPRGTSVLRARQRAPRRQRDPRPAGAGGGDEGRRRARRRRAADAPHASADVHVRGRSNGGDADIPERGVAVRARVGVDRSRRRRGRRRRRRFRRAAGGGRRRAARDRRDEIAPAPARDVHPPRVLLERRPRAPGRAGDVLGVHRIGRGRGRGRETTRGVRRGRRRRRRRPRDRRVGAVHAERRRRRDDGRVRVRDRASRMRRGGADVPGIARRRAGGVGAQRAGAKRVDVFAVDARAAAAAVPVVAHPGYFVGKVGNWGGVS